VMGLWSVPEPWNARQGEKGDRLRPLRPLAGPPPEGLHVAIRRLVDLTFRSRRFIDPSFGTAHPLGEARTSLPPSHALRLVRPIILGGYEFGLFFKPSGWR
jgi:hypothetical protein